MSKQLLLLFLLFFLPYNNVKIDAAFYPEPDFFSQDDQFFLHTVERGQTVYSISVMYKVSADDIYRLNPESKKVIKAGETLKIPQISGSYIFHAIQPDETLYGLARKYYMKDVDIVAANPGLSVATFTIGKIIRIPTNMVTTPMTEGTEEANRAKTNALLSVKSPPVEVNVIKIALLLPLGLKESRTNPERNKMVEYLEGFLLAVKELKKAGVSVELIIRDIGTSVREIPEILKENAIRDVHLLVGGGFNEQIKLLSRHAKEKNIPYVIPFAYQSDEPFNNPNVYQINPPQSSQYSKASLAFINKYSRDNIIIVSDSGGVGNKKEFIDLLKQDLQDKKIEYKTATLGMFFYNEMSILVSRDKRFVIVPSDDSPETLSKLTAPLKAIVETQPDVSISLFGYPNWQVYYKYFSDVFFTLNTTFYAFLYPDPLSESVKNFHSEFYKTYSKVLENHFPKYGMFGYDTGMYFIQLINKYGSNFDSNINGIRYTGVQTDFFFERVNNWGGFINTNMFFVNYRPDYTISKIIVR